NDKIIEVFGDLQRSQFTYLRWISIRRVRRTEQGCRATCDRFEQELRCVQLKADVLRPAECQVWMIIRVIPELVPFVNNATDELRIPLRIHSHQKKRGFHVRCFEHIQNLRCPSWIRAVVKSDRDLMLAACALMIKRWELCKLHVFRREIAVYVNCEPAHSIRAILINSYNITVADIGDCVRRLYQFERLPRLTIELEIAGNI